MRGLASAREEWRAARRSFEGPEPGGGELAADESLARENSRRKKCKKRNQQKKSKQSTFLIIRHCAIR